MSLSLNTIKSAKGSTKKRKRIGRGNASGTGTYSGKGLKGQKCRSGVSNLKRIGMKQVLLRTPKLRGFKSLKSKDQTVNVGIIDKNFKDNDTISPSSLCKKGLIDSASKSVKILGEGKLTLKNLKFKIVKISASAKEQIEKNGCKIIIVKKQENKKTRKQENK